MTLRDNVEHMSTRAHEHKTNRKGRKTCALLYLCSCALFSCSFLEATGTAVGVVGKVGWEAGKAVTSVVWTGSQMAGQTANQTNKTLTRSSVPRDKAPTVVGERAVVFLQKEGKSYFVRARVNGTVWGRFLLDTGASAVQISKKMAKRLHINYKKSQAVPVTLAGGGMVAGRLVVLDEINLGEVAVRNVKAIILDYENDQTADGLLGMSFLENFVFQIDARNNELILNKR
jgi:clan AA aspartic protease (TIGR02281 family)